MLSICVVLSSTICLLLFSNSVLWQMIRQCLDFRLHELVRSAETMEYRLLKHTILRSSSPVIGVYYGLGLRRRDVLYMRTLEFGSLCGSVKNVKAMISELEDVEVVIDIVCTADDVTNLRHPESSQSFKSRHDDVKKVHNFVTEFVHSLPSANDIFDGLIFIVVVDQGKGHVKLSRHVSGEWRSSDLQSSMERCVVSCMSCEGSSKMLGVWGLSSEFHELEDWEIGNCIPNFDPWMKWLKFDVQCFHGKYGGRIRAMRIYGMKAMFLDNWKLASYEECMKSIGGYYPTRRMQSTSLPSRTFTKRGSEHGPIGGDFGK